MMAVAKDNLGNYQSLNNKRNFRTHCSNSLFNTNPPLHKHLHHPLTPITHTTPPSLVDLKEKVKVRMMRNNYRILKSIYIEYKEQKINT